MFFFIPLLTVLAESAQGIQIAAALAAVLTRFGPRIHVLLNELILLLQEDPALMAEQQALKALGARAAASLAIAGDANRQAARQLLAEIDVELRKTIPDSFMRARVGLLESLQRWKLNGQAWMDSHIPALRRHGASGGSLAAHSAQAGAQGGSRIAPGLTKAWKRWKGKLQRQSDAGIMIEAATEIGPQVMARAQAGAAQVRRIQDETYKQVPALAQRAKEKGREVFIEVVDGEVWQVMSAPGSMPVRHHIAGPLNATAHFLAPARGLLRF